MNIIYYKEQLVGNNICYCTYGESFLKHVKQMCVFWITYSIPVTFLFILLFANVVFGQPVVMLPVPYARSQ